MDYVLTGCRVVDFGWVAAGPVLGRLLADLGAEVIRVESRKHPDTSRFTADNIERDLEKDPWFHCMNRNKLGMTANLVEPEAQALLRKLVAVSDVVVENFYPGVMKRRGLDYETLREVNPRLVMISLPGLGSWGPEANTPSYASSLGALSGQYGAVGYPGEGVIGLHQPLSDINTGMLGAFAVLVGLMHRNKTGEGQHIELAQLEGLVSCLGEGIMDYVMNGRSIVPHGNRSAILAPHGNYRCQGEDKWVSIAVKTEEEWRSLCQVMGNSALAEDERFADRYRRIQNAQALDEIMNRWTVEHSPYEVMDLCQPVGVAAVPLMDVEDRFLDPHFNARGVFRFVPHAATGSTLMPNVSWKMSEAECSIRRNAPLMGEHNRYVVCDLLGLSDEELASLEERQILY